MTELRMGLLAAGAGIAVGVLAGCGGEQINEDDARIQSLAQDIASVAIQEFQEDPTQDFALDGNGEVMLRIESTDTAGDRMQIEVDVQHPGGAPTEGLTFDAGLLDASTVTGVSLKSRRSDDVPHSSNYVFLDESTKGNWTSKTGFHADTQGETESEKNISYYYDGEESPKDDTTNDTANVIDDKGFEKTAKQTRELLEKSFGNND